MSTITVIDHVTLDGVYQSPGGPDEDRRGGFQHGGWSTPYADQVIGQKMGESMAKGADLLLGRRTYEHFLSYWPKEQPDSPITEKLTKTQKYVASNTLPEPLAWENSTLLSGDATEAVAKLKQEHDFHVLGSGAFVQALMRADLVDEFLLTIHPIVMGSGRRLFTEDLPFTKFELVESKPSTTGVIIATYRRT